MNERFMSKAKRKGSSVWVCGYYVWDAIKEEHYILAHSLDCGYKIEVDTLCLCTGLRDKEGELIFEGDIVTGSNYPFKDEGKENYNGVVDSDEGSFFIVLECVNNLKRGISSGMPKEFDEVEDIEVIGNTHRN